MGISDIPGGRSKKIKEVTRIVCSANGCLLHNS